MTSVDARQALDRVAASEILRDAENLRHLVLYLGEASLNGRADQLKEYTIGVEVLGRPAHYDPRVDSSARMLAARLRRKLEDYYRGEGSADTVRIGFPKGGYKLTFEEAAGAPASAPPGHSAGDAAKWRLIAVVCAAAFLAVAAYAVALKVRNAPAAASAVELTPEVEALWQPLLDGRTPVIVSFGSPLFVSVGGWNVRQSDLNDWSQVEGYPHLKDLQFAVGAPGVKPSYDYAGIGDVHGAFLVGRLLGARTSQLTLKRGSVLSWEDIQDNNLIFIGNGKNQEKLRYLLDHLEFTLGRTGVCCHKPGPGEPVDYLNGPRSSTGTTFEYGLLSFLPGSRKGRHMILLSANDTGAIWGMAEAVTNPRYAEPLVNRLRRGGAMPKAYQAVIRIGLNGGVPVALDYVVHHELPATRTALQ
ncbi:MAG TPA: hypothetical protein VN442_11855 [Bryobacteraceae bacterium]|nr:hypothetical protein [Bryobacteraceae bacterium]